MGLLRKDIKVTINNKTYYGPCLLSFDKLDFIDGSYHLGIQSCITDDNELLLLVHKFNSLYDLDFEYCETNDIVDKGLGIASFILVKLCFFTRYDEYENIIKNISRYYYNEFTVNDIFIMMETLNDNGVCRLKDRIINELSKDVDVSEVYSIIGVKEIE